MPAEDEAESQVQLAQSLMLSGTTDSYCQQVHCAAALLPGVLHAEPVGLCLAAIALCPEGCCQGCTHVWEVGVLAQ